MGLNKQQIKLIQTAVRAAGLRSNGDDRRYRLLLRQYRTGSGRPAVSCKELTNRQVDDLLAICEAMGWRHPQYEPDHFRRKAAEEGSLGPSFALRQAIAYLAADLGWSPEGLKKMISRMTGGQTDALSRMTSRQAWALAEAMKSMLERIDKRTYRSLQEAAQFHSAKEGVYGQAN